jgi:hypothetical protein
MLHRYRVGRKAGAPQRQEAGACVGHSGTNDASSLRAHSGCNTSPGCDGRQRTAAQEVQHHRAQGAARRDPSGRGARRRRNVCLSPPHRGAADSPRGRLGPFPTWSASWPSLCCRAKSTWWAASRSACRLGVSKWELQGVLEKAFLVDKEKQDQRVCERVTPCCLAQVVSGRVLSTDCASEQLCRAAELALRTLNFCVLMATCTTCLVILPKCVQTD